MENVGMHHYYTPAEGENSISEEDLSSEAAYMSRTDSNSETVYVPGTDADHEEINAGTNLNSEKVMPGFSDRRGLMKELIMQTDVVGVAK